MQNIYQGEDSSNGSDKDLHLRSNEHRHCSHMYHMIISAHSMMTWPLIFSSASDAHSDRPSAASYCDQVDKWKQMSFKAPLSLGCACEKHVQSHIQEASNTVANISGS